MLLKVIDYYFTDMQQQTVVSFLAAQQQTNRMLTAQAQQLAELMKRVEVLTAALNFQRDHSELTVHVDKMTGAVQVRRKDEQELEPDEERARPVRGDRAQHPPRG